VEQGLQRSLLRTGQRFVRDELVERLQALVICERAVEGDDIRHGPFHLLHAIEGHPRGEEEVAPLLDLAATEARPQAVEPNDRPEQVDGDPDHLSLALDRCPHRLADPPPGVGGEANSPLGIEPIHRLDEAEVPLLDQVNEVQPNLTVLPGHGHDEAQVGHDEALPCPVIAVAHP
jgi:hypothetical protein